jgi:hypothetical protein
MRIPTMKEFLAFHLEQTLALATELRRRGVFDYDLELRTVAWRLRCRLEAL